MSADDAGPVMPESGSTYASWGTASTGSAMADTAEHFASAAAFFVDAQGPQGELSPGTRVDDLVVMRLLGRGGMGEVYLARDLVLGRKVALKRLQRVAPGRGIEGLMTEARAIARCNHPHIVTIYAVGAHAGTPYLALEYLPGEDLASRLRRQRPPVRQAVRWAADIADALQAAHQAGVLHRDLKPGNVMLPADGRLRVVDFGLARSIAAEQQPAPLSGVSGTPGYMAPEQWRGEPSSPATDVWALGVMLYGMLAGRRPFEGSDVAAIREATLGPAPVPALPPSVDGLPPGLAELIARCLARDPDARPSVAACLSALRAMASAAVGLASDTPYRGLEPFTERHAALYFGREAELAAMVTRLERAPTVLVLGPSGAGKSSFVQAGLAPRLRERGRWMVLTVRPGADPFAAVARCLDESTGAPPSSAHDLRRHPRALGQALRSLAQASEQWVLLVVDQLEEVFALAADPLLAERFVEALSLAADDALDPVRVVSTMRDAFVGRVATSAGSALLEQLVVLPRPSTGALARILREPLTRVGYAFEEPSMIEQMVAAVDGSPAALPLLEFAAHRLWEGRDVDRRRLTRAALDALGGVEGVLARHADGVLEGFLDPAPVRALCLRLVTAEGTRRVVERTELLDGLQPGAATALDRLIDARLVTARRNDGLIEVELAHESLIVQWHRLARWLDASREERAVSAEVEAAAALWQRRGRRASELWDGDALREARWAIDRVLDPPEVVRAFVGAGEMRVRRLRARRRLLAGLFVGALATVAVVLSFTTRRAVEDRAVAERQTRVAERRGAEARTQARRARSQEAAALRASARAAAVTDRPLEARARLRAALELQDHPNGRALWQTLRESPVLWRRHLDTTVQAAMLDPSGRHLAVAADDGILRVFDVRDGTETRLHSVADNLFSVHWPAPERLLAGASTSGLLAVEPERRAVRSVPGTGGAITGITRLADGELVFLRDEQPYRCHWPCDRPTPLAGVPRGTLRIVAAPGTPRALLYVRRSALRVLDLPTGRLEPIADGDPDFDRPAVFVDDDTLLIGNLPEIGDVGEVRLVDGRPSAPRPLWRSADERPPVGVVRAIARSGDRLAIGDYRGAVWLADGSGRPVRLGDHGWPVVFVGFVESGAVLSLSVDGSLRLWRVPPPAGVTRIEPGSATGLTKLMVDAQGRINTLIGRRLIRRLPDGRAVESMFFDTINSVWGVVPLPGSDRVIAWLGDRLYRDLPGADRAIPWALADGPVEAKHMLFASGDALYVADERGRIATRPLLDDDGRAVSKTELLELDDAAGIAVVVADGRLGRWSPSGGRPLWLGAGDWADVTDVALSVDRARAYASSWSRGLLIVDLADGRLLDRVPSDYSAEGVTRVEDAVFVVDAGGRLLRWHDLTGSPRIEPIHRTAVRRVTTTDDGRVLVSFGADHIVRTWDTEFRPQWRGIALLSEPGGSWTGTHRGWHGPDDTAPDWAEEPWAVAVLDGISAAVDGQEACVVGADGAVHRLRRDGGRPVRTWRPPGEFGGLDWPTVTLGGGRCLVRHGDRAWLWSPGGAAPAPLELSDTDGSDGSDDGDDGDDGDDTRALFARPGRTAAVPDGFALLAGGELVLIDPDGAPRARLPAPAGATAVVPLANGDWVFGLQPGHFERWRGDGRLLERFGDTPPSPVTALAEGPMNTLLVGHADGQLGLWSLADGERLRHARLNGGVVALAVLDGGLTALSDAGDQVRWSLAALADDHCALMRSIWAETPVVWRDRVVLAAPPTGHPCAAVAR